ncbi:MAG: YggS family pyridoxal phosphate-dependent enzyme [Tannerella sp.]|jgi:pyridoxal phosphate enzyme (YggS family)|nr:YggS family pyridoxal phosphate-dependent enzyme [Tannerella sp.]
MGIKDNISKIKSTLPEGVTLIAVSKFHSVETVKEAYDAGQRIFGENRVRELTAKQTALPEDIEWHFIGTLQTNKVKHIAPFVTMIHSVDSLKLMQEINRQAEKCNRIIRVLVEVHIAGEDSKHGFSVEECKSLFSGDVLKQFANIQVRGLMGMATFTDNKEQIRREFGILRKLFDEIRSSMMPDADRRHPVFRELSMGMSDDYQTAIEEGSTMVRIGTGIFGARGYDTAVHGTNL